MEPMKSVHLTPHDALVIVDVQNDFLPRGSLAVPQGDDIIPVLNAYMDAFARRRLPIVATRDWHPANHCSFAAQGGIWPPHCVADSPGACFPEALSLPASVVVISKATAADKDAYSGFDGTDLATQLKLHHVQRVFVGGLATDYCVLHTVKDALAAGFEVVLLTDAIRAVDVHAGDGQAAIGKMIDDGAEPADLHHFDSNGFVEHTFISPAEDRVLTDRVVD
jgi:nicotinamidase/pyrazinamidase